MTSSWQSWPGRLWFLIRRDFWRKLIALFFAGLVYYSVEVKLAGERRIAGVPLEVILPPELIDMDPKVHYVTVTAVGSRQHLPNVDANSLRGNVRVDYSKFIPGSPYQIRLTPDMFHSIRGARVNSVEPGDAELTLNLQRKKTRNVELDAQFDAKSKLSRNYEIGEVKYIPSEVQITGPEALVDGIGKLKTMPIPLDSQVVESFEYTVPLAPPVGVDVSPSKVRAQIEVNKNYITRIFNSRPVSLLSDPAKTGSWKIEFLNASRVEIAVSGLEKVLTSLNPDRLKPYLDLSGITEPGVYKLDVNCYAPAENMNVKSIYPEQIQIKITK